MGTKRILNRYDVHCMGCGRSYEVRRPVKRCNFKKCKSEDIICEDNSKYVIETIFPGKEPNPLDCGLNYYPLSFSGDLS
jgi:hypothetical protein